VRTNVLILAILKGRVQRGGKTGDQSAAFFPGFPDHLALSPFMSPEDVLAIDADRNQFVPCRRLSGLLQLGEEDRSSAVGTHETLVISPRCHRTLLPVQIG
jgi:hypothetical protein